MTDSGKWRKTTLSGCNACGFSCANDDEVIATFQMHNMCELVCVCALVERLLLADVHSLRIKRPTKLKNLLAKRIKNAFEWESINFMMPSSTQCKMWINRFIWSMWQAPWPATKQPNAATCESISNCGGSFSYQTKMCYSIVYSIE